MKKNHLLEKLLLADILNLDLTQLLINRPQLSISQKQEFELKMHKLNQGIPLDYLLKKTEINNLEWILNKQVLIPRPETESLINLVLKLRQRVNQQNLAQELLKNHTIPKPLKTKILTRGLKPCFSESNRLESSKSGLTECTSKIEITKNHTDLKKFKSIIKKLSKKNLNLLDLGCSSGFIGLSLAKVFKKTILSDVSNRALNTAKKNLKLQNQHQNNIDFYISNLLKNSKLRTKIKIERFVLIANLPYLPVFDKLNSKKYNISQEPCLALYSGRDGLGLFKKLIFEIQKFELDFEVLIFELDPRNIFKAKKLASKYYKRQLILEDFNGLARFLLVF